MKKHRIAVIINYCTNDYRFLDLCLEQVRPLAEQVIVPVCDHFFNGMRENQELLNLSYREHPDVTFIEFHYDPDRPYGLYCPFQKTDDDWIHYWHSTSRYVGFHYLKDSVDFVLFLDVDEILDIEKFIHWLDNFDYLSFDALRLSSYFYFRKPTLRAKSQSLNALMVKKTAIENPEQLLTIYERKGVFDAILGTKVNHVVGLDDAPMVHHYSWVREEKELLQKVKTWGHHYEKEWESLLKLEFSQDFSGIDSLYGLSYDEVTATHDPLKHQGLSPTSCSSLSAKDLPHVFRTNASDLFKLNIRLFV
jgi:hypothetical protein